MKISFKQVIFI